MHSTVSNEPIDDGHLNEMTTHGILTRTSNFLDPLPLIDLTTPPLPPPRCYLQALIRF